jgi:hypothetical protein
VTTETIQQRQPHLTFACELDRGRLTELFSDGSIFEYLDYIVGRLEELGLSP